MKGWTQEDIYRLTAKRGKGPIPLHVPARKTPTVLVPRFDYADELAQQCALIKLPMPTREYRPWTDRRFRLDLAWLDRLIFAECDGGEWVQGQHSRGQGMIDDCYKWNRLTLDGWTGFRFCGTQVKDGSALTVLETALR